MAERIGVTLLQTELTYQGLFSSPSFRLLTIDGGVLDRLSANLGRFGLRAADVRIETGVTLADAAVTCWLFSGGGLVRVRAERMEGIFAKVPPGVSVPEIVSQVFAAVQGCVANIGLQSHTIGLSVHANLTGGVSGEDFVRKYVNPPPPQLGPTSFCQLSFRFPGENERVSSSLEMEPSVVHPGALFARLTVVLDAQIVSIENAFSAADAYARKVADSFGFDLRAEPAHAS